MPASRRMAAAARIGAAGLRRRFRARGRCARRRARHPFGALGRAEQGFRARDAGDRATARRTRRRPSPSSARRISSRRSASPGRTGTSRNSRRASTARWSGRRAATPASATIRCSCPTATRAPSARCRARRSTACRRAAQGLSHRARAFLKLAAGVSGREQRQLPRQDRHSRAAPARWRSARDVVSRNCLAACPARTARMPSPIEDRHHAKLERVETAALAEERTRHLAAAEHPDVAARRLARRDDRRAISTGSDETSVCGVVAGRSATAGHHHGALARIGPGAEAQHLLVALAAHDDRADRSARNSPKPAPRRGRRVRAI